MLTPWCLSSVIYPFTQYTSLFLWIKMLWGFFWHNTYVSEIIVTTLSYYCAHWQTVLFVLQIEDRQILVSTVFCFCLSGERPAPKWPHAEADSLAFIFPISDHEAQQEIMFSSIIKQSVYCCCLTGFRMALLMYYSPWLQETVRHSNLRNKSARVTSHLLTTTRLCEFYHRKWNN